MVNPKTVTKQLRQIGCDYAIWGRTEIHELSNVLMDDERIMQAVNGYYDGGFALLCTTNYRVLVVDKKPFLLTVEDLRYDMIAEVDYSARIMTSVIHIYTPMRTLMFTSWSITKLRKSMNYIQQRVMELRNNDYLAAQFTTTAAQAALNPTAKKIVAKGKKLFPLLHQKQRVPQMVPTYHQVGQPTAEFDAFNPQTLTHTETILQPEPQSQPQAQPPAQPTVAPQAQPPARRLINPYTKVPLLARRRKYPSFY